MLAYEWKIMWDLQTMHRTIPGIALLKAWVMSKNRLERVAALAGEFHVCDIAELGSCSLCSLQQCFET